MTGHSITMSGRFGLPDILLVNLKIYCIIGICWVPRRRPKDDARRLVIKILYTQLTMTKYNDY